MQHTEETNLADTVWQVEVGGQVYQASFEELTQWIAEGALQPDDKVRRGNLRWLEANKIPTLHKFFNAKEQGQSAATVKISTSEGVLAETNLTDKKTASASPDVVFKNNNSPVTKESAQSPVKASPAAAKTELPKNLVSVNEDLCFLHADQTAQFFCTACAKNFCQSCPKTYGSVKICPECGEMCRALSEIRQTQNKKNKTSKELADGFSIDDLGRAFAYPFKFSFSLISSAILFTLFTVGQSAAALGGIFLVVAAIFCWMLANTLTFGILANTVENFSQGKTEKNFMPEFEDFNLWDDVIHPFVLSLATYLVSFGLVIVLIVAAFLMYWNSGATESKPSDLTQTLANIKSSGNAERQNISNNGAMTVEDMQATQDLQAKQAEQLENQIRQAQEQAQKEALNDNSPSVENFLAGIVRHGKFFFGFGLLAVLWGLFFYPAACTVAGYTRSLGATLNPLTGLDTIKRFGVDYVKILFFSLIIVIFASVINYFLNLILAPLSLPQFGNIPAKAIGSLFGFYFSVVFSVLLGQALYKNSEKFNFRAA